MTVIIAHIDLMLFNDENEDLHSELHSEQRINCTNSGWSFIVTHEVPVLPVFSGLIPSLQILEKKISHCKLSTNCSETQLSLAKGIFCFLTEGSLRLGGR